MKLILGFALALAAFAQAPPIITPGPPVARGAVHHNVDLSSCYWVTFKQVQFQARTSKTLGEVEVSIERPGIADCISDH